MFVKNKAHSLRPPQQRPLSSSTDRSSSEMYLRPDHAEDDPDALQSFIQAFPLGVLTTCIPHQGQPTIQASHLPFVLDRSNSSASSSSELGVLRCHLARKNPQAQALISAAKTSPHLLQEEALVLFTHPVSHAGYVTPQFYTKTKPETGKVVPTWNYAEVHAYGRLTVHHDSTDPHTQQFLQNAIEDLTRQQEKRFVSLKTCTNDEDQGLGWKVSDAPESYINILKKAIIGVEIQITQLGGKFKMSQEIVQGDRDGVVQGFKSMQTEEGEEIARLVGLRAHMKSQEN